MAEYFSHDYNTREDEKIRKLIRKHSMEGYGIYWSIIEMLYLNGGIMEMDCEDIGYPIHIDGDLIKSVIMDFKLFKTKQEKDTTIFFSTSVLERIKVRKKKADKARESAKTRWDRERGEDANA